MKHSFLVKNYTFPLKLESRDDATSQFCLNWDERESNKDYSDCEERLRSTWGCPKQPSEISYPNKPDAWWAEREVETGGNNDREEGWKYDICCSKQNSAEVESLKKSGFCDPHQCEFNKGAHFCIRSPQMYCREKNSRKLLLVSNQCCYRNDVHYATETGSRRVCSRWKRFWFFFFRWITACKWVPWSRTYIDYIDNSLITSGVGSGSMLTQLNSLDNIIPYYFDNLKPYKACSMVNPPSSGLDIFKKHRPTISSPYNPRQSVMAAGDPSIATLDGIRYAFMGIGVYTLLESSLEDSTVIQASMRRLGNGTVFSGLSLSYPNHSLECYIDSGGEFSYALNGNKMTLDGPKQYILHGFSVTRNTDNKHFTFELLENNLRVQAIITDNFLNFVVTPPEEFRSNMGGLLGHFDGDSSNDFTAKGIYFFTLQFEI